jgi:hypothetical protein
VQVALRQATAHNAFSCWRQEGLQKAWLLPRTLMLVLDCTLPVRDSFIALSNCETATACVSATRK